MRIDTGVEDRSTRRSGKGQVPVSVLIPAKNEEPNIADCIRSAAWADDIVVVDSHSVDRTAELAERFGARVVQFDYVVGGPKKKNWALENAGLRHDWILVLDADERVTPRLAEEIGAVVLQQRVEAGFYVNVRFYFLSRWVRHCGYYPCRILRLFRKGVARYETMTDVDTLSGENEVHERVVLQGPAGRLAAPLDHLAYPSIESFVEKHNRYSNWEARLGTRVVRFIEGSDAITRTVRRRRALKRMARALPFPHWLRFFYHYILRLGFLDGKHGYVFCHLLAEYEFLIWAKRWEAELAEGARP